jgi:hypothetical protein
MSKPGVSTDKLVAARCVLLDALQALQPHLDAVILVGAQAIYLHTLASDLITALNREEHR